ncbi:NAD-dependent epimerase/dehydratase family protein [Nocardia sp. NBC_00416]|uniref:NAD-dependent epimerase/dehydratase family protein n=1 Tax=Nocardia sp. NBC_00416 TaxID=2975991 RepID=UPI002E1DACBC
MAEPVTLVVGASGFLGSHLTRQLVAAGAPVRVMVRHTSDIRAIADLPVQIHYGDLFDDAALREAMRDCDVVYHCAVDTRAWLRDPEPLFRTNIAGLRHVLDAACATGPRKFVFTSSAATIGRRRGGVADETAPFDWGRLGGPYVRSRVEAENLVLRYAAERELPAVAMCVANTYGPGDWQPTPHGSFVAAAALGELPFRFAGTGSESVGVEDAARALILAGTAGRDGERYIVSDRYLSSAELLTAAAHAVHREPPRLAVPLPLLYPAAALSGAAAALRGRDSRFTVTSVNLMHVMSRMDHGKAERELGWKPEPVLDAVARAARFFVERRARRRARRD